MPDTIEYARLLRDNLPFWQELDDSQRVQLAGSVRLASYADGEVIHRGEEDCVGLLLVLRGQIRVYTSSEEGRELTLYRLLPRDVCLLSASCMLSDIRFDVNVSAQQNTDVLVIPPKVYRRLMDSSLAVANYTNRLMASHFSEVMWLIDQIMNKKMDSRLAALLLEEQELRDNNTLTITHEQLANHLGSVREVVTRMLRYFANDGTVSLGRGSITLEDVARLRRIADSSGK